MPGFGRCPSPLPREWLRFPGCAQAVGPRSSRLMTVRAARGRHLRAVTQPDRSQYRGGDPGLVSGEMS